MTEGLGRRVNRLIVRVKRHPVAVALVFLLAILAGASKGFEGVKQLGQFTVQLMDWRSRHQLDRTAAAAKKGVGAAPLFASTPHKRVQYFDGSSNSAFLVGALIDFMLLKISRDTGSNPSHFAEPHAPDGTRFLSIAQSKPKQGQRILLLGMAGGAHEVTVVEGTVTGLVEDTTMFFKPDATVPDGFEGAPCLDPDGNVLGLYVRRHQVPGVVAGEEQARLITQEDLAYMLQYLTTGADDHQIH